MKLSSIVEGISEDLRRAGAVGGDDTRRVAEALVASVESSLRLHLLDALQEAAAELAQSSPGYRVEVRMEGRDPVLSLVPPDVEEAPALPGGHEGRIADYLDDELARLTLRLPEGLKGQVEGVAGRAGASINSWIVSALAQAIERPPGRTPPSVPQPSRRIPRRMTGYVRG